MSSGLFSIARSALTTHQTVMQTISQNIANAETPGYSRQEAQLVANTPVRLSYGNVGTGVSVSTIIRKRDMLLDDGYRSSNASLGNAEQKRDGLQRIEGIFGEPSDVGMSSALDQFWGSWSDLATSPGSTGARAAVQQRGAQVASLLNSYDTGLTQQRTDAMSRLDNTVNRVNQLAQQVADLNDRIVSSEVGGNTANDLRDQRDRTLDELSKLAGTRTFPQRDGSVTVVIGNSTLVDSSNARPLSIALVPPVPPPSVVPTDVPIRIRLGNSDDALFPLGGELQAAAGMINTEIPSMRSRLDALATSLVQTVNAAHRNGYTFTGSAIPGTAAGDFFDAGSVANPVRAGTIRLDALVAGDISRIASSSDAYAPTNNGTAQAMSALRETANTVSYTGPNGVAEQGSFVGFFRNTVTRLGIDLRRADDDSGVYQSLVEQADNRRQSVSGVNTDEELVNMLRVQQSYVAATKLIKAADEMLQTLLQMV